MNEWSFYISRDPIFLLCVSWFIYFALQSIRQTESFPFVVTFILAWSSMLFRVEGCIVLFFYLTVLAGLTVFKKEHRRLYLFRAAVWIAIPAIIAGFAIFLTGSDSLSINRFNFLYKKLVNLLNGNFLQQYHEIYQFFEHAENSPPFSGWHYNLAALARHYIFLLYTAGIMEIIVKTIFILSVIPLYSAARSKAVTHGSFFFWMCVLFVGFAYYCLITKDFLATRFLLIPSFLMLIWVGAGTEKLRLKAFHSRRKKMILILVTALIIAPAAKSFEQVSDKDDAIPKAAKWLKNNGMISKNRIMTNEKAAIFYAGLYAFKNFDTQGKIFFYNFEKKPAGIEKAAKKKKADILLIKIEQNARPPELGSYDLVKRFTDNVGSVILYQRKST